jgi:hypothetical protein
LPDIPIVDFSTLGNLGQTYRQAQAERSALELQDSRRAALKNAPRNPDGTVDFTRLATGLVDAGDLEGAKSLASLADSRELHRATMQNQQFNQGITERTTRIAEKNAEEKPQYISTKDANDNPIIVQIDPYGKGSRVIQPQGAGNATPTNPYSYGKQNENQSKDSGFANRLFSAEEVLRDPQVISAATSPLQAGLGKLPGIMSNYATNGDYQRYDQAARNFVNAVLRRESGAAISQSEFDNAYKQYFPQPGDTPERIAQKQANRMETIKAIAGGGGRQYRPPFTFGPNGELVRNEQPAAAGGADPLSQAKAAIARGANRDAVIQRLRENGIDPSGL